LIRASGIQPGSFAAWLAGIMLKDIDCLKLLPDDLLDIVSGLLSSQ
jgi:hypothetical protein